LCKSALPVLLASACSSISYRQAKVYHTLLAPTGMTPHQFKAMDVLCLDWLTLGAEEMLEDGDGDATSSDYDYWLYAGHMAVSTPTRILYNVTATTSKERAAESLLGETKLVPNHNKLKPKKTSGVGSDLALDAVPTMIQAGPEGATLLRIHIPKLRILMKTDKDMEDCMRTLAFQGLQGKLTAQLLEA
jgi:hypothetical protein